MRELLQNLFYLAYKRSKVALGTESGRLVSQVKLIMMLTDRGVNIVASFNRDEQKKFPF